MEVVAYDETAALFVRRWHDNDQAAVAFNFGGTENTVNLAFPAGRWRRLMDSAEECWQGPGSAVPELLESTGSAALTLRPYSFALFAGERTT
jgi:maltooligosyltrehalose trehalohydrolase